MNARRLSSEGVVGRDTNDLKLDFTTELQAQIFTGRLDQRQIRAWVAVPM